MDWTRREEANSQQEITPRPRSHFYDCRLLRSYCRTFAHALTSARYVHAHAFIADGLGHGVA